MDIAALAPSGPRCSSRRLPRVVALGQLVSLVTFSTRAVQAFTTTRSPNLFGPKSTLVRYRDAGCTRELKKGAWLTQSWTRFENAGNCYELMSGYLCNFRCTVRLSCQFESGSGILAEYVPPGGCTGAAVTSVPFAEQLYWLEAKGLFEGQCMPDGKGMYMKFRSAVDPNYIPNCERFGEVMPGENLNDYLYEAMYTLQFYKDLSCKENYTVDAFSDRPTSAFSWRYYRGRQYCYDMVDATPRAATSPVTTEFDFRNWRMLCGNADSTGNGIMIQGYQQEKCGGTETQTAAWQDVFYPMNYDGLTGLLAGRCTLWGKYRVKFDRPLDPIHYPDCKQFACKQGACNGGRMRAENDTSGQMYTGEIRTSGADPAQVQSLTLGSAGAASRSAVSLGLGSVFALAWLQLGRAAAW